jgi:hypothetical protein|tara:strand:+ start:507 stop:686 length:180 start_codon:yes stop_codon:yes gene_type:complete
MGVSLVKLPKLDDHIWVKYGPLDLMSDRVNAKLVAAGLDRKGNPVSATLNKEADAPDVK